MGRKKVKPSVYLTEQSTSQLREVVAYLEDRVSEMEIDEEFMEESGENLLPLLRGLVSFLKEEHLEEDESDVEVYDDEVVDDDYPEDDEDGELEF